LGRRRGIEKIGDSRKIKKQDLSLIVYLLSPLPWQRLLTEQVLPGKNDRSHLAALRKEQ
jgi:hypothetical protein